MKGKITHGGKRPGSGKKTIYGARMVQIATQLPAEQVKALQTLGGIRGAHIRAAIDLYLKDHGVI